MVTEAHIHLVDAVTARGRTTTRHFPPDRLAAAWWLRSCRNLPAGHEGTETINPSSPRHQRKEPRMFIFQAERLRATGTHESTTIDYERLHITCSTTPDTIFAPPEPIVMGPIIHDAEEVTS